MWTPSSSLHLYHPDPSVMYITFGQGSLHVFKYRTFDEAIYYIYFNIWYRHAGHGYLWNPILRVWWNPHHDVATPFSIYTTMLCVCYSDDLLDVYTRESGYASARFSLRLSSQLMRGLVRLYQKKVTVFLSEYNIFWSCFLHLLARAVNLY